jgi:hypothetical protein
MLANSVSITHIGGTFQSIIRAGIGGVHWSVALMRCLIASI